MSRLKMTIAYHGRDFEGWQSQPGGNTIQDKIQEAITDFTGLEGIRIHGSGRTDSGVHALGQVAHLELSEDLLSRGYEPVTWREALNVRLPGSVRILRCEEMNDDFHARYSARRKTYFYDIWNHPVLHPMRAGLALHIKKPLDLDALRVRVRLFKGQHDFGAFSAKRQRGEDAPDESEIDTVRRILTASVELPASDEAHSEDPHPALIRIRFQGNGFLYRMVRLMVGTALHNLDGDPSDITRRLEAGLAERSPFAAPAHGLYLAQVEY